MSVHKLAAGDQATLTVSPDQGLLHYGDARGTADWSGVYLESSKRATCIGLYNQAKEPNDGTYADVALSVDRNGQGVLQCRDENGHIVTLNLASIVEAVKFYQAMKDADEGEGADL
jgi:hypothetical protein